MISSGPILVKRAKVLTKLKTPIDLSVKQRNKVLTNYVPSGPTAPKRRRKQNITPIHVEHAHEEIGRGNQRAQDVDRLAD